MSDTTPPVVAQDEQIGLRVLRAPRAGESRRPLFLLHGVWTGETPLYCFALARSLERDQPLYAFDPYRYAGPCNPLTLEELAAAHLRALRALQPVGPYQLMGFCNGAAITYEMVRQLQEQGEVVDFLLLISPTRLVNTRRRDISLLRWLGKVLGLSPLTQLRYFLRLRHIVRHVSRAFYAPTHSKLREFTKLLVGNPELNALLPARADLFKDYIGVFTWLAAYYRPDFIPENVRLIWAGEELINRDHWQILSQQQATVLPGYHLDWIAENPLPLVQQMKIYIEMAQKTA